MWLLNVETRDLESFQSSEIPAYAILSHRWTDDEPSFKDVQKKRWDEKDYLKLELCRQQAVKDGFQYIWIDTCCIDKRSSAELSEAINSMYNWYTRAAVCYVYLFDVGTDSQPWIQSQWFTRGWTLQELLAPQKVEFYDMAWERLGDKIDNSTQISRRTGIPLEALREFDQKAFTIAQRMSWAKNRCTTRSEDRAYSLLGIFDVNMPLLYGEGGGKAFYRLQEEIMKTSTDPTIFAWSCFPDPTFGMLAGSPDSFKSPLEDRTYQRSAAQTKLRSFRSDYVHLKAGISGTFSLRQHMFNIYVAGIGELVPDDVADLNYVPTSLSNHYSHLCIFLQHFPSEGQFERVSLDGAYYIELDFNAYSRTSFTKKTISISRCAPRAEDSDSLSNYACRKLSLSISLESMFHAGWLNVKNVPQPSDASSLIIPPLTSNSFVAGPCIVLENKLFLYFAYSLHQKLTVFISSFEGNLVTFMLNGENLFSPAPAGSIEQLRISASTHKTASFSHPKSVHTYPHKKFRFDTTQSFGRVETPPHALPPLNELIAKPSVKLGDICRFTFCQAPANKGHRVLISFNKSVNSSNFEDVPVPKTWCIAPPLSHKLWEILDQQTDLLD